MASHGRGMTAYGRLLGSLASTRVVVEGDWEEASKSCEKSSGRPFKTARVLQNLDTAKGANPEEARKNAALLRAFVDSGWISTNTAPALGILASFH